MRLKLPRRFWTIESIFFQSASSPSPPCRRAAAIENPPLRWFWWIFFQWIFPRVICCVQFIKVLNLRIIDIFFFSLVVKFVEQLNKNFIALYLHCFLMNLELFYFKWKLLSYTFNLRNKKLWKLSETLGKMHFKTKTFINKSPLVKKLNFFIKQWWFLM